MSKYSDIKKRVVGQMGSTDNKSGSGYSASGAYYDIKKKIKTQGTKYDIDDEYLDSFYSDAKSFFDDADSDYNNNSYSTAKANNENYKSRWSDLNRRAEYIRSYINSRKNSLDDETYSGMMSYLDQFNNASRQYLSAFRNASNYYSQWKTEDEYNDAVEAQKLREEMLSDDLDAAKKDIDALKAVRDAAEESSNNRRNVTYNDLVSAYTRAGYGINAKAKAKADYEAIQANNSKVDSEIASILEGAGYSNIDELNDAITKKSTYYNTAKRLQDSAALYDKAKSASDFSHYASVGDALSNEKIDGLFVSEYDKKNKIGYLRNNPEAMDAFDKGATRAGNDPLNYPVYKAAKYMTNDEYKVYSSYLGRGDTETAEKYLSYLDDELNQRASKEAYKLVKGNTLSELIFGVKAGLDQFKSGIENLFNTNDEYIAPSYIQYASGMVREDLADAGFNIFGSSLGQIGYDLITTTSNMMPSILASSLVSMAFPGAQVAVAGKVIGAGQVVGAGLMGASAAGNAYQEMLNLGYDKGQARTYSTLTGLSEAGLQSILGGIGSLGGVISGKSIESIAKGINNAAARFAIQFGGEMASEGLEEFLQDILDPLFKSYATKEFLEIPEGYLEQAVYSGMLGALSAGVLNGFDRATNRVMEYGAAQQIKDEGKVNELVKVGKLFSADTVAYKLADKVTDNTGAWKLSKLLHEVNANLSEQNQADIKYNLVRSGMREADADTVTEWLAKAVDGGKFTSLQQKALDENPIISRVFKKVIIDKNSTVNQRIQGMMNINGVEGQSGIDYAAIAKSQSKENLNKSANYNMAVKQAIAEKNKRDLGIGRTTAFNAKMDRKASDFATEYAKSNNSLSDNSAVKAVKQDVSEKVSDTNKTTVVSTGEEVSIKKIKSISNGNMELELTNGNTVNSKDIKYKSQDEALVYESVLSMGYSADTANAIVNGYNALTGVSASNYLLGVNEAYNYGRIGYPQESIKSEGFYADLTDAQKRFAYNLGREAAEAETKSAQNAIKKGSNNKTGKVHITSSISSMTQRQKASVSAIGRVVADVTHNDVYIYESVEKDGKRVFSKDIAGHKAGEKAPNGFYDPNTGAIFIDINAGNGGEGVMLWTAAHELTHFIRQWSPEKFKVLADFLMEEYGKNGVDIQTLIQDQINKAKRSGRKLSFEGAYEEVVADAMQTMFTDTNLSEKIAKLKAKDETLWQKIKSFFADLYKRITEAYKGLDPQTDEAKFVRSMKDSIEKLSDMFAEAIVDAGESFSTADVETINNAGFQYDEETGTVYSERFSTGTENEAGVDRDKLKYKKIVNEMVEKSNRDENGTRGASLSPSAMSQSEKLSDRYDVREIQSAEYQNMVDHFGTTRNKTLADLGLAQYEGVKYSDRYDAKQRYVDRVMSKNAEVETLSDDQHWALRKVAEMRHKFHSNPDGLFNTESASYDMWNYVAQDGEINKLLEQAGLPTIEFGDYTYTPSTFDYEELGGKDEYETLEEWKEQSGVMDEFYKDFNDANERIEKYLRTIDEEHGTQYAPSGFSRLNSDRNPDATDNRTLLSNALESVAQNDNEKKLIERYKSKIDTINKEQKKLTYLRAKIKELSFAKGHRDAEQISKLQAEATKTANLISKLDKRLLKLEAAKPLKDVIDRERTLAKKKAEKAGKEALSAYREKAVQTQRELMNRYQERIKSGVENRRKHEFVNKIEKIAYDIQYRLEHPSAKTVIPEVFGKSVANFLKALDFTTFDNEGNVREGKANKTRAELRLSISNLADNLAKVSIEADYGQLDISADMLEWLKKMSTMLEEKYKAEETFYVRKMNSEELGDLYKLIKSLQTSINQASKFYTNMSSDVESIAYNTITHLEPLYGKTHNTMLDSVDKLLRWDYAQPITVFDRFGDSGRTLMRMLMQGQKTMSDNAEAIENFVQTAYTAEEVNKWREELHKITIQGKTYEVSTAFLMEFHNLLRDPDAKRHILEGGGIRFDDLVIGKKKTRFGDTYVTLEEAAAIDNVLTERQKQVAESLEKFLSEKGADWGNKISMRRFGYHAFGNIENYYPIKTIKAGSEYEARQKRANIYALLNKSFTKERNIHADNAIIVGDIFQTFNDHMSEMALYNAWALPVIDLIKWFNYRETQDVENKISEVSVKEALRQAYGKNADEYIRRLLESINSQNSGGLSESIAFKNLRIVNRVAVSANLRVAIQQPFSITRAMELISPKYVKPLVGDAKNNAYNEMVANSSFGKWKSMGYYDVDVSRPLEVKVLKNASFADKFTEKSMFLAEAGDNFTWAVLWNACKAEVSEKNKGITNDELIAKTGERFDDIIIRTQVVDSVLTKSQWMRSDSFFHRMTSSFMSESMTSYNTLLRQYDRYSADAARTGKKSALKMNGKPIATTVTVFVLTQLINALATAPLDAARDDDDYKTFLEKMLEKFKRSALQNLLPTSMMPYIADIVEYAMYGNTDRPDLQLYTKAIDLGKQLKRTIDNYDYFKLHKLINSALSMASSISGIPMSNIARDAIAVWNTVVGNIGNGELKFQTSPDSSSVAYEKMYEAIVNGKTDKATKLYAQMQSNSVSADSINSALTSRVKQDYIDGKIDSDEASRLLKTIAEYTGKELTDDEIYWKIDKWNYEDENGTSDGYAKYDDFFSAVETGNDLRAVIQEYTENGVDKKTLASQITSHFKPIYVGMTRSERASIKGYLLNAYALLGYDRTEKSKDIDNWLK